MHLPYVRQKNRHAGDAVCRRRASKATSSGGMGDGTNSLDRPALMQAVEHGGAEGVAGAHSAGDFSRIDRP